MPIVSLTDWNNFLLRHPNVHLLQTGEWGELKSMFGWKPVRIVDGNTGVQILFRQLPLGFTIGYIPKTVIGDRNFNEQFWQEIDFICREHRAIFCKIEPDHWENEQSESPALSEVEGWNLNLETSPNNIQPPRTIIVDIKSDEEEILARMKQKTRYNIRLAGKKGVTVRTWDDIEAFHKMMLVTGGRDGFGVHALEYYQRAYELLHPSDMGEILVAEYEDRPLAALFVARDRNRAYYLYGASTDDERTRMPAYLLQWEAMKWAKERGCEEYDLWGVPDEDEQTLEAEFLTRHEGLWGVYRFKRGFGGEVRRAAQALDKVYNPLFYWAYLKFIRNRE
jgi:lipid II:glycine glycyltransferase (peptidoglycan interpeptide bridge formation enzyme)